MYHVQKPLRLVLTALFFALAALSASAAAAAAAARFAPASYDAHGSVEQVYATGITSSSPLALLDRKGHVVARKQADAQGGVLFRNVKPGHGYRLRQGAEQSAALTVLPNRSAP